MNSIDGVVWEGDQQRQFTFVSKQAQKLLGYPAETWLNEPSFWKEHIHAEDRDWAVSFCQKAIAERKDVELEYRMMHADTRTVWIREILNVGLDGKGDVKLRGVMLDMTERKRMETALRKAHDELEYRVYERTTELSAALDALRESERKYRLLVEGMTEGILQEDKEGRILFVNPRLCEMVEYSADELLGNIAMDLLLLPEDREFMREKNRLRDQGISDQYEIRIKKKSGDTIWAQVSGAPVMGVKGVIGSMGILTDVTERKLAEKALRESEERYALAVTGANDGLWDWDLKTNKIYFSERWKSMLGYSPELISNSPDEWFKRVHPDDFERLKAEITSHLKGNIAQLQNEHRMLHQDGSYRWMLSRGVAVRDIKGAYRMAGSQTDVTERKLAVEQLLHDAFHDALTNLSNRALFMDRLSGAAARATSRARRGGRYLFAVLFLDLDRFKVINDSLGHLIGDQLLISIARRLEKCLRPGDTIARLGGDEFAILIEDILDVEDAITVAKRIQSDLKMPLDVGEQEVFTSASIGIALSSVKYEKAEDLLRDADTAMYRAKALGKARYEVFSESMHGRAVALLQLETDLRRAIERNEFVIHYQPIVSLQNRKVIGFEALVRWKHPDRG
ncbi:MAG TPA: PAS domain S-box protein, partial [Acidobacteriota bacterium]